MSGELEIEYDPGTGKLAKRVCRPGDVFWFPQGAVHRTTALSDVVYLEVSTPFLNDRVHVEGEYGLEEETGGLPTTLPEEVEAV